MRFRAIWLAFPLGATAVFGVSHSARADFTGFGDFSHFHINHLDSGALPNPNPITGTIQLTNQAGSERRSIFYESPQSIQQFTASFTYWALNISGLPVAGLGGAFVLQNSAAGANAVGSGYLGYAGIDNSTAIALEPNVGASVSGFYQGGVVGGGSTSTLPEVDLRSGHPINVTITYNGTLLQWSLLDTVTLNQKQYFVAANLPAIIGSSTAYVGLTASTATGSGGFTPMGDQFFQNLQFSAVPEPASLLLMAGAGTIFLRRRIRR